MAVAAVSSTALPSTISLIPWNANIVRSYNSNFGAVYLNYLSYSFISLIMRILFGPITATAVSLTAVTSIVGVIPFWL